MKILIVSRVYTHPIDKGNSRAIFAQAEALKSLGNDVHFLYIDECHPRYNAKQYEIGCEETKKYWGEKFHYFKKYKIEKYWNVFVKKIIRGGVYWKPNDYYPWGLHKYVNKLQNVHHFDACIVNYFDLSKLLTKITIPKKALHTHDSFTYRDIVTGATKNIRALTPNDEAIVLQRAPYIFALQDGDADFFHRLSPKSKIYTIYTTITYHPQPIMGNHNILFLSANEIFNINGLDWFLENVYFKLQEIVPDTKLLIGGGICKGIKERNLPKGVILCGYVDDVGDFFQQGDIAINPVYQGTGLKIKTIESMSYDKVTIVHPHSQEGLFRKEKQPLFASEKLTDWINYIIQVWNNQDMISEIKKENKRYIEAMNSYILNEYKKFMED